jgi:REP-associated tyrosine transposase
MALDGRTEQRPSRQGAQYGLGLAVGEVHRRHINFIQTRGRWTGHLFQSRFALVAMDELHLQAAVSHVSLGKIRRQHTYPPKFQK